MNEVERLLVEQSGVIARRQLLLTGLTTGDIRRQLRRRELVPLLPGTYVDHTGEPTWLQRAWAGVLAVAPAALFGSSALRALDGPGRREPDRPIEIAVDRQRSVKEPMGYRLHRVAGLEQRALWNVGPPRMRVEEAVLDVAAQLGDEHRVIATLTDAVQSRRTTPRRLRAAAAGRNRLRNRSLIATVLTDLDEGTQSVLEHGYLLWVERAHGLPRAQRQVRVDGPTGRIYRDNEYAPFGVIVELDGRTFHASAEARAADLQRDLEAASAGKMTVRAGWSQVFETPCVTAAHVAHLLVVRGWAGSPSRCARCQSTMRSIGAIR